MLEPARLDLGAIPVLAERLERSLLPLLRQRRTTNGQRILLLVEQHTRLACFDARLCKRHVGIVAEREPMLSAGEVIAQCPRGAVARLLAKVQPVAVAEQHRLAASMSSLYRQCREFRACHFAPLIAVVRGVLPALREPPCSSIGSYRFSYNSATCLATSVAQRQLEVSGRFWSKHP